MFLKISQNPHKSECAKVSLLIKGLHSIKRQRKRCFSVNFANFLWTPNLWNIFRLLLLKFLNFLDVNIFMVWSWKSAKNCLPEMSSKLWVTPFVKTDIFWLKMYIIMKMNCILCFMNIWSVKLRCCHRKLFRRLK